MNDEMLDQLRRADDIVVARWMSGASEEEKAAYHKRRALACGLDVIEYAKGATACDNGVSVEEANVEKTDSFLLGYDHQYAMNQQACHMGAGNEHN